MRVNYLFCCGLQSKGKRGGVINLFCCGLQRERDLWGLVMLCLGGCLERTESVWLLMVVWLHDTGGQGNEGRGAAREFIVGALGNVLFF